jgi:hypothetical protein
MLCSIDFKNRRDFTARSREDFAAFANDILAQFSLGLKMCGINTDLVRGCPVFLS